jgi:hypothetical protein
MLRLVLFALAVTPTLAVAQTLASTGAPATNGAMPARIESRTASAVRATTTPVLDGRVDENICAQGQTIDQFLEYEPGRQRKQTSMGRTRSDDHV